MKIDLCKTFKIEEGEEFKIEYDDGIKDTLTFKIKQNNLYSRLSKDDMYVLSRLEINIIKRIKNIIKLKKKEFTDNELCILRNIDKKYKWIARDKVDKDEYDKYGNLNIYFGKPKKSTKCWLPSDVYCEFHGYNHLLQSIKWEDEEPVYIDDYVERYVS